MTYTLDIRNFQSIAHQQLKFTGFTAITGRSDLGKSATRRAIESVLFNSWQKSYQRNNTKHTNITLTTEGLSISCQKSKTDNSFTINDKHIDKMNKDAPPLPLPFRQDLNISTQLEPMFMVAYKDVDNTRLLNQLFGIDTLETAQYLCSQDLRHAKQDATQIKDAISQHKQQIEQLTKSTTQLKALLAKVEKLNEYKTKVSTYIALVPRYTQAKEKLTPIHNQITQTVALTQRLQATLDTLSMFYAYYDKRVAYNKAKRKLENLPTPIDSTPLQRLLLLANYTRIIEHIETLRAKKTKVIPLDLIKNYKLLNRFLYVSNCKSIQGRLSEIESQVADIVTQLATMVCPTCKQPIG